MSSSSYYTQHWQGEQDPLKVMHQYNLATHPDMDESVLSDADVIAAMKRGKGPAAQLSLSSGGKSYGTSSSIYSSDESSSPTDRHPDHLTASSLSTSCYSPSNSTFGSQFSTSDLSQTAETSAYGSIVSVKASSQVSSHDADSQGSAVDIYPSSLKQHQ